MNRGDGRRIRDIEVLRGIAITMVYLQHTDYVFPTPSLFVHLLKAYWHGAAGVDLFFAISGFVIARSLLPRLRACPDLAAFAGESLTFLVQRFWRLQPAAWLWILITILLSATFNRSGAFRTVQSNLEGGLAALLDFYNFWFAKNVSAAVVFSSYWSLSFEEQFYVVFPVLVLLLRRHLVWLLLALLAYQFCMDQTILAAVTRPGGLAVGVLLALWSAAQTYPMARPDFLGGNGWLRACCVLGAVLLLGALESPLLEPLFSIPQGLIVIFSGALVYAASFDRGFIAGRGRVCRVLEWLGARSYAIYLVHFPVFAFTREIQGRLLLSGFHRVAYSDLLGVALSLPAVLVLSHWNYRLVEAPGRRYGHSLRVSFSAIPGTRTLVQ